MPAVQEEIYPWKAEAIGDSVLGARMNASSWPEDGLRDMSLCPRLLEPRFLLIQQAVNFPGQRKQLFRVLLNDGQCA